MAPLTEAHGAIAPLADEWDALVDRTCAGPFVRPGWIESWWRAFGRGELHVLATRRDGRLTGVLPLYREGAVVRSTTNDQTPQFEPVAEGAGDARALAEALCELCAQRASVFFLDPGGDGAVALRAAAEAARQRVVEATTERSPYIDLAGGWEEYAGGLESKLRSEIRRRRRRLEAEGELRLELSDGRERLEELLAEGFQVEAAGWKGEEGTAIAATPAVRAFYTDVARWASERGSLLLAFLRHDGRALAFDYCLEEDGLHYLVKTGFDPSAGKYAPGIMMRHDMIERAFAAGLRGYEFLGHDDDWKLRWTSSVRERVVLRLFAASIAGRLNWLSVAHARPAAKRLLRRG